MAMLATLETDVRSRERMQSIDHVFESDKEREDHPSSGVSLVGRAWERAQHPQCPFPR